MKNGSSLFAMLTMLLAGCDSGASVEGMIGGSSFELSTVYAWIDATEAELDPIAGKITFPEREDQDLHIIMSGASYDPEVDSRFVALDERIEIELDEERFGRITIAVSESQGLTNGMVLTEPEDGDGPDLNANHRFGAVRVEADAEYPAEAVLLGSRVTYTLTVDEIMRARPGYVTGTFVVSVERSDQDPASAQIGTVTVDFSAELIGERIAECNRQPEICDLVLP